MNTRTRGLPLTASYYRFALAEPSQLTQAHVNGDVGAAPLGKEGKKGGFFSRPCSQFVRPAAVTEPAALRLVSDWFGIVTRTMAMERRQSPAVDSSTPNVPSGLITTHAGGVLLVNGRDTACFVWGKTRAEHFSEAMRVPPPPANCQRIHRVLPGRSGGRRASLSESRRQIPAASRHRRTDSKESSCVLLAAKPCPSFLDMSSEKHQNKGRAACTHPQLPPFCVLSLFMFKHNRGN